MNKKTATAIQIILTWVLNKKHPNFYRKRYRALLKKRRTITISDFSDIPFLDRADLEKTSPYDRLFLLFKKLMYAHVTSGTTGKPLLLFHDKEDLFEQDQYWKKLVQYKVKKLLYLVNTQQVYWKLIDRMIDKRQQRIFVATGDVHNLTLSAQTASQIGIDSIETNASILYFFMPHLQKVYDLKKIRFISLGGEYTSKLKFDFFKRMFPHANFDFRYGNTEAGVLGYRCGKLSENRRQFFHPVPRYYYEVVDGNGSLLPAGKAGELIVTTLKKVATPLIRYKTGDLVRLWTKPCRCGATEEIEVLGRREKGTVKIQGTIIYPELLDQALEKVKHMVEPECELHIFEIQYKGKPMPLFRLKLIAKKGITFDKDAVTRIISDNFYLSSTLNLTQLVERGLFLPLEIEWVESLEKKLKSTYIVNHII